MSVQTTQVPSSSSAVRVYDHLIDGEWTPASGGSRIDRISPANGTLIAQYAQGGREDVERAIVVARRAFDTGPWPRTPADERSEILSRLADRMAAELERLARIEAEEVGKPIREARNDIGASIKLTRYAAALGLQLHGESHNQLGPEYLGLTLREPVGVAGLIVPWNFPAIIFCQKAPFALAAGCTTVVKPSELCSGTILEIAQMALEVGVPAGVINVVTGYGPDVGQPLVESADVDFASFTGSTATGRRILAAAAPTLKRVSLELGGKNANVVFADANLDDAVDAALFGVAINQGECCASTSRLLVEATIADDFLAELSRRASMVRVGQPLDEDTELGALIHPGHLDKVADLVASGNEQGAEVLTGGSRLQGPGYDEGLFWAPTVIDQVTPGMRVFQEEIFGPVLSVTRFSGFEEAAQLANETRYGLTNAVWSQDIDKALGLARRMRSGVVWVNTTVDTPPQLPFGGYGQSGIGRENGSAGLEEFTEVKSVNVHIGARTHAYRGDGRS